MVKYLIGLNYKKTLGVSLEIYQMAEWMQDQDIWKTFNHRKHM